jgi:hypothetical protein
MSSFSADAVQYSTGDSYYLSSQAGGNLSVTGDIVSRDGTAGRVALQLTTSKPSVALGDVTTPQNCALSFDKLANTLSLIGSEPELDIPGGIVSGAGLVVNQASQFLMSATTQGVVANVPVTASSGGSGKVTMSGGGSGGTIQSYLNDGTSIAPLQLQPAGEGVLLPFLSLGSLQMNPATPAIVESAGQLASGTCVIAGLRIAWGLTGNGTSPTVNFKLEGADPPTPDNVWFSEPPLVFAIPEQNGGVVGYCTPATPTRNQCNIANTTSGGTGFGTRVYWLAIGPA